MRTLKTLAKNVVIYRNGHFDLTLNKVQAKVKYILNLLLVTRKRCQVTSTWLTYNIQ